MPERDANQLAADKLDATRSALVAALNDARPSPDWAWDILNTWDELVALVGTLQQERDDLLRQRTDLEAQVKRLDAELLRWWAEADVLSGRSCDDEQADGNGPCGACVKCLRAMVEWDASSARRAVAAEAALAKERWAARLRALADTGGDTKEPA